LPLTVPLTATGWDYRLVLALAIVGCSFLYATPVSVASGWVRGAGDEASVSRRQNGLLLLGGASFLAVLFALPVVVPFSGLIAYGGWCTVRYMEEHLEFTRRLVESAREDGPLYRTAVDERDRRRFEEHRARLTPDFGVEWVDMGWSGTHTYAVEFTNGYRFQVVVKPACGPAETAFVHW